MSATVTLITAAGAETISVQEFYRRRGITRCLRCDLPTAHADRHRCADGCADGDPQRLRAYRTARRREAAAAYAPRRDGIADT